jgi:hypothetical protein
MAISKLGQINFAPYYGGGVDRSMVYKDGEKTFYSVDLQFNKIDPQAHIKWCRRNLGERNRDWDFTLSGGLLVIETKTSKATFAYELWKN